MFRLRATALQRRLGVLLTVLMVLQGAMAAVYAGLAARSALDRIADGLGHTLCLVDPQGVAAQPGGTGAPGHAPGHLPGECCLAGCAGAQVPPPLATIVALLAPRPPEPDTAPAPVRNDSPLRAFLSDRTLHPRSPPLSA